ncbi:PASTA domain-containing protein [Nocardioides panacisoli]|uniref:PASTA domain-containing protein n=1 Tax=Nocardioides panacisoli TaxID=627624 RepID=A0ABP7IYH7_9ACTN
MPTENDARELLARAAATIVVDQSAPLSLAGLPEPTRPRWPLLLATAAAVVLVLGGGWLVATHLGSGDSPPLPADHPVVEHEHAYASDEMPSLVAYTTAEARATLAGRGVDLTVRKGHSCTVPAGYVVRTTPAQGMRLHGGDAVRLDVSGGPGLGSCTVTASTQKWSRVLGLIRFARGLGGPPAFSDDIVTAAGGMVEHLTATEAADPGSWTLCDQNSCHSVLAAIAQLTTVPHHLHVEGPPRDRFLSPLLDIGRSPNAGRGDAVTMCVQERSALDSRPSGVTPIYVSFDPPVDGRAAGWCPPIEIDLAADGSIAGVELLHPIAAGTS